jgi:hypothetical protein
MVKIPTLIRNRRSHKKHKKHKKHKTDFLLCFLCLFVASLSWIGSSDRLKFSLGVFAGDSIQEHASTGQQTRDVKGALSSVPPGHYFSAKNYFHPGSRPRIGRLISLAAGPACSIVPFHHNCTNRAYRSCCQRHATH